MTRRRDDESDHIKRAFLDHKSTKKRTEVITVSTWKSQKHYGLIYRQHSDPKTHFLSDPSPVIEPGSDKAQLGGTKPRAREKSALIVYLSDVISAITLAGNISADNTFLVFYSIRQPNWCRTMTGTIGAYLSAFGPFNLNTVLRPPPSTPTATAAPAAAPSGYSRWCFKRN